MAEPKEDFKSWERKELEAKATANIDLSDKSTPEAVLRELVAEYQDGVPRSKEQATVDLMNVLSETLRAKAGFRPAEDPVIYKNKRGLWAMTVLLVPYNQHARTHLDELRRKGHTIENVGRRR